MAASKRAKITKRASDYRLSDLTAAMRHPMLANAAYSWDIAAILSARDAQMRGAFSSAVRLAESMGTDDAISIARKNRLAPLRALRIELVPASGPRGATVCREAEPLFGTDGISISSDTIADVQGDLVDHGIAVAYNECTVREDGSRVDMVVHPWPLELCWWDSLSRTLVTQVDRSRGATAGPAIVPITHGDGRWIVFRAHEIHPWRKDAAVLSACLVWARHAFAARDISKGSASHGNAKVIGQLPEGIALQRASDDGSMVLTSEATEFLALLQDIASLDTPVGIAPAGSKIEYLTNGSRAWEVWRELMAGAEKAAARIYLGTDGVLGSQGGAPGVDIATLFGVATTRLQGDIAAIERGIQTGTMVPWAAINHGSSDLAPSYRYVVPDPDAESVRDATAKNEGAICRMVQERRAAGFTVTQEWCDEMADRLGVERLDLAAIKGEAMGEPSAQHPQPTAPALRAV